MRRLWLGAKTDGSASRRTVFAGTETRTGELNNPLWVLPWQSPSRCGRTVSRKLAGPDRVAALLLPGPDAEHLVMPLRGHPLRPFRTHVLQQVVVQGGPRVRAAGPLGQTLALGPVVVQLVVAGGDIVAGGSAGRRLRHDGDVAVGPAAVGERVEDLPIGPAPAAFDRVEDVLTKLGGLNHAVCGQRDGAETVVSAGLADHTEGRHTLHCIREGRRRDLVPAAFLPISSRRSSIKSYHSVRPMCSKSGRSTSMRRRSVATSSLDRSFGVQLG